ncbi:exonuclease domain-containing protein [Shewanella acanthi]|uniref:exonuclease domain-containing protein n=1 Tax=Shewanella acanthi TaxID=2864212 RepID=UPI001C659913|nr:exonuclease domain-containing protein [Shewanella acanthi]QYJ80081.1 3'-5' exonuclease [Shewanella acanthi]
MSVLWAKAKLTLKAMSCRHAQFKDYYESLLPLLELPVRVAPLMAMDLEMTGLDPIKDQILSIGLIPINKGVIELSGAEQCLVQITGSVGQSATIHGIVDSELTHAVSIEEAMVWFMEKTRGRVLVAHYSPLDSRFLQHNIQAIFKARLILPTIDTLMIERTRLLREHSVLKEGMLRLGACRERYALPVYSAHSALTDALACAELLLAQVAAMGNDEDTQVAELLSRSG